MSLVIALALSKEALIAADHRVVIFHGEYSHLEEELYSGKIRNDDELKSRAKDLGASLCVSDSREKVCKRGPILMGEVQEISRDQEKRRRIYLAPGAYVIADFNGPEARVIGKGGKACLVIGNRFTQFLAKEKVLKTKSKLNEQVLRSIFEDVAGRTASISREYTVLRSDACSPITIDILLDALREDCQKSGWRLCDQH
ncbi:MAG: DUF2121 domain-containing protein [Methanotrichaceae archaeon]|nr:DUF2121 domain-containing protein [Methanotrichaceae archaeon]